MSAQPLPAGGTLRHVAASEVRAELARQRKTSQALARALGISPQAMSRRTTGDLPFDIDELEIAARFLNVPVAQLLGLPTPTVAKVPQGATITRLHAIPTPRTVSLKPHSPRPLLQVVTAAE